MMTFCSPTRKCVIVPTSQVASLGFVFSSLYRQMEFCQSLKHHRATKVKTLLLDMFQSVSSVFLFSSQNLPTFVTSFKTEYDSTPWL